MRPFPATVDELIRELDRLCPEVFFRPGHSHDEAVYASGRRSVLKDLLEWQKANINPVLREKRGAGRVSRQDP